MGKKKMKITDLINNPPPIMQPQVPPQMPPRPEPTEKSQIVINFKGHPPTVMRYNSTKKGEKAYTQLTEAWARYKSSRLHDDALYFIEADMFISTIDLSQLLCLAYVDHAKRSKFIPV